MSPRAAHLPLSVASCEEPALSWNRPHAMLHHQFRRPVVWITAGKPSPLYQRLKRYCPSEAKTLASLRAHRAHGLCEKRSTLLLLACLPPRVTTVSYALDFKLPHESSPVAMGNEPAGMWSACSLSPRAVRTCLSASQVARSLLTVTLLDFLPVNAWAGVKKGVNADESLFLHSDDLEDVLEATPGLSC